MKKRFTASLLASVLITTSLMQMPVYADESESITEETPLYADEPENITEETIVYEETQEVILDELVETYDANQDLIRAFVSRLYTTILSREPDAVGLQNWVNVLANGNSTGADIVCGFVFSDEFTKRNYSNEEYVTFLYKALFDRMPDSAGLQGWLSVLEGGLSRRYVLSGFIASSEFNKLCTKYGITQGNVPVYAYTDQHEDVTRFVAYLYKNLLNRNPDAAGLEGWVKALVNKSNTACQVVTGFTHSNEFTKKEMTDTDYVSTLYRTILSREPDAAGLNSWVKLLDSGVSQDYVLHGFLESGEFTKLCNKYGINRGTFSLSQYRDKNTALTAYINHGYVTYYGRKGSASELENWAKSLLGHENIITDFHKSLLFSSDSKSQYSDDFIRLAYQVMLQRVPSDSEISNMKAQASTSQKVFDALNKSSEYEKHVNSIGLSTIRDGWVSTNSGKQYIRNGVVVSGWDRIDGARYYFNPANSNYMVSNGWKYIDGFKYYFDSNGKLVQNVDSIIGRQSSYYLTINTGTNTVTAYAKDGNNGYIIPVKAMICATGISVHPTIKGTFVLRNRFRWRQLMGDVWGQYCVQIHSDYLFHSSWYYQQDNRTLSVFEYNRLGTDASHGCVRLTVADAKWIYDNCIGSTVTSTSDCAQPFDKPDRPTPVTLNGDNGYDPTDPAFN